METIPDRHGKNKHKITSQKCLIKEQNIIKMQYTIKTGIITMQTVTLFYTSRAFV